MALFSFHCQNYKAGALVGIDGHNRRLHKNHKSNPDIDNERSANNIVYVAPKKNLYADCKAIIKEKVIDTGHRVRKDSNWICECIFSYPEELPPDRMDDYFELIIKYMGARLGKDNVIEAVAHCDEGGLNHLHLDILLITPEGRLSSKALITRGFIQSIHDKLPIVLQAHGFDVERGAVGHEGGLSAKEYKKQMEIEAKEISHKIDEMVEEHNRILEIIKRLREIAQQLELGNLAKARDIVSHHQKSR
mgnify:FL=1